MHSSRRARADSLLSDNFTWDIACQVAVYCTMVLHVQPLCTIHVVFCSCCHSPPLFSSPLNPTPHPILLLQDNIIIMIVVFAATAALMLHVSVWCTRCSWCTRCNNLRHTVTQLHASCPRTHCSSSSAAAAAIGSTWSPVAGRGAAPSATAGVGATATHCDSSSEAMMANDQDLVLLCADAGRRR